MTCPDGNFFFHPGSFEMTKSALFFFLLAASFVCLAEIDIDSDTSRNTVVVDPESLLPAEDGDSAKSLADFAVGYLLLLEDDKTDATSTKFFVDSVAKNPEARLPIAILVSEWFKKHKYQECIDNFMPISERHPEAVDLNLSVASALIFLKKEDEAIYILAKTFRTMKFPIKDDSTEISSCQNLVGSLSELYGRKKMFDDGEDLFDTVLDDKVLSGDFKIRRAAALFFSLRADQGEDGFFSGWTKRRFRKKMDQNLEACENIWNDLIQQKDKKSRMPPMADIVPMLEVNKRYNLFDNSERIILNTMISQPENEYLLRVLGTIYSQSGQYGMSCRIWKLLTQRNNSETYYYYELGHALLMMKNYAESAKSFEWMILLDPDSSFTSLATYQLGICYYEMGKFDKALYKLDKIKDMPEAKFMAAICLRSQQKYQEAVKSMEAAEKTAIELKRDDYLTNDFYLSFAAICDKAGLFERTVEILKKEVSRNPEDPETVNFLGYLLADKNKDLDYAEKLIRIAVGADSDNSAFLDSLAWVLYRKGDFKGARKYMDESLKHSKGGSPDAVIADHAGDIYFALGDKETALKFWKIAAETWNPDLDPETVRKKISEHGGG